MVETTKDLLLENSDAKSIDLSRLKLRRGESRDSSVTKNENDDDGEDDDESTQSDAAFYQDLANAANRKLRIAELEGTHGAAELPTSPHAITAELPGLEAAAELHGDDAGRNRLLSEMVLGREPVHRPNQNFAG